MITFSDLPDLLQGPILNIHVFHIAFHNLQAISGSKPLKIVIPRQIRVNRILDSDRASGLVRPSAGDIFNRISTAAEENEGDILRAKKLHAVCVTLHCEVEATEFVAGQRVGATLKDDDRRLIYGEDFCDYL